MQAQNTTIRDGSINKSLSPLASDRTEVLQRLEAWLSHEQQSRKVVANAGRIEAVEEPGGGRCQYVHDQRGDLVRIIEANGSSTGFAYDEQRRLIRVDHPDGTATRYTYGANERLVLVDGRGVLSHFTHDAKRRLTRIHRGNAGAVVYRYDESGRIIEAHTSVVMTHQEFDTEGRTNAIRQSFDGVAIELRLQYDTNGRLAQMVLPGSAEPVGYQWDARGRPQTVALGHRVIAKFEYGDEQKSTRLDLANGIVEETKADPIDSRPVLRRVRRGDEILFQGQNEYTSTGQIVGDGARRYEYDPLGRLIGAKGSDDVDRWRFAYDALDNRTEMEDATGVHTFQYNSENRLQQIQEPTGGAIKMAYDRFGRPIRQTGRDGGWTYRYDDAGQLLQVLHNGNAAAQFSYDHKGRLARAQFPHRVERYLYGPADELLAVTDEEGNPLRLYVRTPLGMLAEINGAVGSGKAYFRHHDDRGTCHLVTDENGEVVARFDYTPFGAPATTSSLTVWQPVLQGRIWHPEIGMYNFGARWYHPHWGRFLTPDSYTGRPDDERLMHPLWPANKQFLLRAQILTDWLKQPRVRNHYVFCGNDPVNRVDPNGHWSFGGVLLMLLGAIWTLPNTIFGLLVEITCLAGEVVRWLVWLISFGHVTWETPGFDVAASGRLNAFALVFSGGWLGSISSLLGITFGNVFFVNKKWEEADFFKLPGDVYPPEYCGRVAIPRKQALYEHELRHTNQYGWFGPFFHLGLPIFGVYLWDFILSGVSYSNMWLERDAREHAGL